MEEQNMSTEQAIYEIFTMINQCDGNRCDNIEKALKAAITYLTQHELPIPNLQLYEAEQNE